MSKNNNKKNTSPKPAETATPEPEPVETGPATAEEAENLFEAYYTADAGVKAAEDAALAPVNAAKERRSDAVKHIAERLGNGPFNYKGKLLSVVKSIKSVGEGDDKREVAHYSFKSSKQTVTVIGG